MLRYWIARRPDGTPAGLVRIENDRVRFTPTAPIEGRFWLFSGTEAVPVVPDAEVSLPGAVALLGMHEGQETCCAAADAATPLEDFRKMLSQICTKNEPEKNPVQNETNISHGWPEDAAEPAEAADTVSLNSTIETDPPADIDETARDTAEFSLLLRHAEAFYNAYESPYMVQNRDNSGGIDLFPQTFPGATWRYTDGLDVLPHYEGTWRGPGGTLQILAVKGRAAPRPPRALVGFTRYLRGSDGAGYWIRTTRIG